MAKLNNSNFYPFPNRVLRAEKKKESYTLDFGKAIYSFYNSTSNANINNLTVDRFRNNRRWGNGTQNVEKLKDHFAFEKDNVTGQRKGYSDLDYNVTPVAPRFVDTIIEILSEKDNHTNVVFLDADSSDKKQDEKYSIQAKSENKEFSDNLNKFRGIEPDDDGFLPENKKELDAYEAAGGIRLPLELGLETGLDYIFNYDLDWNNTTAPYIKDNLIKLSVAGLMSRVEPSTGRIVVENIDPEMLVIDASKYFDYRDAQFMGIIRDVTVLDVYKTFNATMGRKMSEDEVKRVAEQSIGESSQYADATINKDWYDAPMQGTLASFMSARVRILDFVHLSIDIEEEPMPDFTDIEIDAEKIRDNELKSGKIRYNGKKYIKRKKSRTKPTIEIETWRRGKMVIDTDIVYDYGKVYDQLRDERGLPIAPFSVVKLMSNSIIERCIPHFEALQLNAFIKQNLKAQMKPRSIVLDLDAISNLTMGGQDFPENKVIKTHRLGATLLYSSKKSGIHGNERGNSTPIFETQGGMGSAYQEIAMDDASHWQQIQMITGLNDVALAQNPNPEVTAAQAQMAQSGATNAIMNIYKAYKKLKKDIAYRLALHLQSEAQAGNPYYKDIIGEEYYNALADKENVIANKEIKIIDNPSREEVNALRQQMNLSLQNQLLKPSDIFEIESLFAENKPLKVIAMIMNSKEEKAMKMQQENAAAAAQQNSQQQQAMIDMKNKSEQAKAQFKGQVELEKDANQFEYDRTLQSEEYQLKEHMNMADDLTEKELFGEPHKNNTSSTKI